MKAFHQCEIPGPREWAVSGPDEAGTVWLLYANAGGYLSFIPLGRVAALELAEALAQAGRGALEGRK